MNKLPVIILEDSKARIKKFRSNFPWADIFEVAAPCKTKLSEMEGEFDLFLDHDLGNETYVDSEEENTGMEVVRYIEANPHICKQINQCVVHSLNEEAARNMARRLKLAGVEVVHRIPYTVLWDRIG